MTPPLLLRDARVITVSDGPGAVRGGAASGLAVLDRGEVLVHDGVIRAVGGSVDIPPVVRSIDAGGRVLMPAFIDAHTHACWAGSRLDEWEAKLAGAKYLDLLGRGGGIMATVRAVREASVETLADGLSGRLEAATREGTATIEIKSGYGLDTASELKMLDAIRLAGTRWPGTIRPTACIGHAIDGDAALFIDRTIKETLPAIAEAWPGITLDAYCENGAWSLSDCERLFSAGADLGLPFRVHADQFSSLGMIDAAIAMGGVSVDHLEATPDDALSRLAGSDLFGVMLPCSGFHLDGRYANGRAFLDACGKLVVSSNCNPGSAPCISLPTTIGLAVRHLGISVTEAIIASTVNAAALLGFDDRGRIAPGCRADIVLLAHSDERELGHSFGAGSVDLTIVGGDIVYDSGRSTRSDAG